MRQVTCGEFVAGRGARAPAAGVLLAIASAAMAGAVAAAEPPAQTPTGIYTCVDDRGRRLTSDRPIPECMAKEQRILNSDGSLKAIRPPTLTAEERARQDAEARRLAQERAAQADAVRRDRNLMARYPDQMAHDRARESALDTVRLAIRTSALRMNELGVERKLLLTESEFYVGKALPSTLKAKLDANDAATAAQRAAMQTQEAEFDRVNRLYDAELAHLRQLWAGARPGSLPAASSAQAGPPQ